MRLRAIKVVTVIGVLLILGLVYAGISYFFNVGIPCPFKTLTGLSCPGCGVSRMCIALLSLNFKAAFMANVALFIMLPILLCLAIISIVRYIKYDTWQISKPEKLIIIILIVVLIAFGFIRNISFAI